LPQKLLYWAVAVGLATLLAACFILFPDNSGPDQLAHILSDQVNTGFQILAHLLMFFAGWRQHSWRPVIYNTAVALTVTAVVQLSKIYLIADIAIRPSGGYEGFPSGHASATFSLAFVLSLYYPRLSWFWYAVAGLVSWSRVQTNAHAELQIAAGMLFGTIVAYSFAIWLERKKTMRDI
jgi:membrane-associated phospholipid phosphatase